MTKDQFAAFDRLVNAILKEKYNPSASEFEKIIGGTEINLNNRKELFAFWVVHNCLLKSKPIQLTHNLQINVNPETRAEFENLLKIKLPTDQAINEVYKILKNDQK